MLNSCNLRKCRTAFDHAPDPASALAAIEAETGDVNAGSSKDALKHLRHLLEREIEAQVCKRLCQVAPDLTGGVKMGCSNVTAGM